MRTFLTLFLAFTVLSSFSQNDNIIGEWKTTSSRIDKIQKFDNSKCFSEYFQKGNGARIGYWICDYEVLNDTLFNYWTRTKDNVVENMKEAFEIVLFTDSLFKLKNSSGDTLEYYRISSEMPITEVKLPNTFYSNDFGLACISDSLFDPESGYNNCLCFGDINFETTLNEYIDRFGEPAKIMENEDGSKYYIFILTQPQETFSYLAVQILNNETTAIQLTGKDSSIPLSFSTIKLGDYFTYVGQRLGKQYVQKDVEDISGFMWDYNPFPFSVEFDRDMRVYSIRLSKK